jgi:hypothetical protein
LADLDDSPVPELGGITNYRLRVVLYTGGCNWALLGPSPR